MQGLDSAKRTTKLTSTFSATVLALEWTRRGHLRMESVVPAQLANSLTKDFPYFIDEAQQCLSDEEAIFFASFFFSRFPFN